jgi:uncharacterized membrane protein
VKTTLRRAGRLLSRIFLQGLAVTLPIGLTAALLYWAAVSVESLLGALLQQLLPHWRYWPGLGIAIAVALTFAAGVLVNTWVTKRLVARVEALLDRIPVVKSVYGGIRDIAQFLSAKDSERGFKQVVAVRLAERARVIGFVTADNPVLPGLAADGSEPLVAVYLPMSYQIGGYTLYVPRSLLEPLDMPAEEAMRLILIAGMSSGRRNGEPPPG